VISNVIERETNEDLQCEMGNGFFILEIAKQSMKCLLCSEVIKSLEVDNAFWASWLASLC